jgi:hypothetical protein
MENENASRNDDAGNQQSPGHVRLDQLKMSPDLDPFSLRDRELEARLHSAYDAPNYWEIEAR